MTNEELIKTIETFNNTLTRILGPNPTKHPLFVHLDLTKLVLALLTDAIKHS